jgi:transposase
MSNKKAHEFKENLERCYEIVQQSSTKGISAVEVAKKLGKHRTTVHSYLNTLEYMGKVESHHGIWHAKTGEQTIKPLEKEIVIELPIPKNEWQREAFLEAEAKRFAREGFTIWAEDIRIFQEKLKETRTIKIKGKNVDDLNLEKIASLIQHANQKSSKPELKGIYKILKRALP